MSNSFETGPEGTAFLISYQRKCSLVSSTEIYLQFECLVTMKSFRNCTEEKLEVLLAHLVCRGEEVDREVFQEGFCAVSYCIDNP